MPWKDPEKNKIFMRKYCRERYHNPIEKRKDRARQLAREKFPIAEQCSRAKCGEAGQRHHPDYSKPLEIIWLCKRHHTDLHYKSIPKQRCIIKGCKKKFKSRNLCTNHYYCMFYSPNKEAYSLILGYNYK